MSASEIRVVDGDTFVARGERYRLADIDATELRGPERAHGLLARDALRGWIDAQGSVVVVPAWGPPGRRVWPRDRYWRRMARWGIEGAAGTWANFPKSSYTVANPIW